MYNKKEISSVTILTLVLLLLISLSLQSLVNFEIGQVGRNLVGKATDSGSGQVMISILSVGEEPPQEPSGPSGGTPYTNVPGFKIDYEELKVLLKVDKTTERIIEVSNTGDTFLEFTIKKNNLMEFIDISETEFSLSSGESKDITIYINSMGKQAGLYISEILFKGGSLEVVLPVIIEIESLNTILDVRINIPEEFKVLIPGEDLLAKISMFNVGDIRPIDIVVDYFIKDMDGNVILGWDEKLSITEGKSFSQTRTLPGDINLGMYVLYMEVRYGDTTAVSGSLFEVKKQKGLETPALIDNKLIVSQVWQSLKESYGGVFIFLVIIVILLLILMGLGHYMSLKRIPSIHHKKMKQINKKLQRDHTKRMKQINRKLQRDVVKDKQNSTKRKKLKNKLKIIEEAYRLKHISKKSYEKIKKRIDSTLNKL